MIHGGKGGPEYWFYTKILPLGGKYIIKCDVNNTLNRRKENHVFVIDADYKEAKQNVVASLIDNQATNKLTGCIKIKGLDSNFGACKNSYFKRYNKLFLMQNVMRIFILNSQNNSFQLSFHVLPVNYNRIRLFIHILSYVRMLTLLTGFFMDTGF